MSHTLIVSAVVLLVYGLAAAAVLLVYRTSDDAAVRRMAARRARTPAAGDALAQVEADAARRLIAGDLDPAAYRVAMAALAARDAVTHPLTAPEPPRQDGRPGGR